ncbi:MAG TPA: EamA family transporter [Opitutaceae bacterium]|nr:EamA family transporter [Opitutaceae bacterium]
MTARPDNLHRRALLMLVLATAFWGLSFPVIKALVLVQERLLPGVSTWFATLYLLAPRFALALVVLLVVQARDFWKVTRGEMKQGVVIGLFSTVGMLFQNDGLQFTAASTSAFLTQFYAIVIPVYLALRSRTTPGARVWVSCALVLAGVAILGNFNWRTLHFGRGEWETLVASTFFVGQILWLEKPEFAANRPAKLTLVMFATQALLFTIPAIVVAPDSHTLLAPWTSPAWLGLTAALTVVCTLGSYLLMNAWQPKITATEAGLIYCAEPIFGSVMALFLPAIFSRWAEISYANETTTWTLLAGGFLITLANVLIQVKPPPKPKPEPAR